MLVELWKIMYKKSMIVWKRYSVWCVMLCECIRTLCDRLKTTWHKHYILLTIYWCYYHHTTVRNSVFGLKTVRDYFVTPIMQIQHFATAWQLRLFRSVITASYEFAITSRIVRNFLVIYMRNLVRSEGTAIFATPHFLHGKPSISCHQLKPLYSSSFRSVEGNISFTIATNFANISSIWRRHAWPRCESQISLSIVLHSSCVQIVDWYSECPYPDTLLVNWWKAIKWNVNDRI